MLAMSPTAVPATPPRLVAIDWLRGLVMVLMAVDHVDAATNRNHAHGDSALRCLPAPLPPAEFLTRWATHLCAPTFLLLAGMAIGLASARANVAASYDRHLARRGVVLLALEFTLVSFYWRAAEGMPSLPIGLPVFAQVLFALGVGMVLLVPLRRLAAPYQLLLALGVLVAVELSHAGMLAAGHQSPLWRQLLADGGMWHRPGGGGGIPDLFVLYPALPWLPAMLLGHVLGTRLVRGQLTTRHLLTLAAAALATFALVRGLDGFGNMGLHRRSSDLLEWLHCSKYPPSVAFLALELGLALLLLALLQASARLLDRLPSWNPILVLGQVPLFFYLLHLPMIAALQSLGVLARPGAGSAAASWWGAVALALACWPLCAAYRAYRQRWRHAWTRYL